MRKYSSLAYPRLRTLIDYVPDNMLYNFFRYNKVKNISNILILPQYKVLKPALIDTVIHRVLGKKNIYNSKRQAITKPMSQDYSMTVTM